MGPTNTGQGSLPPQVPSLPEGIRERAAVHGEDMDVLLQGCPPPEKGTPASSQGTGQGGAVESFWGSFKRPRPGECSGKPRSREGTEFLAHAPAPSAPSAPQATGRGGVAESASALCYFCCVSGSPVARCA